MIPEEKSKYPFMQKICSSGFKPNPGVTHYDSSIDKFAPNVTGGEWKHPRKDILSRKEFNHRKSLASFRDFGP